MTIDEVAREEAAKYGVTISDAEMEHVVWAHTGYPAFWATTEALPTPEAVFRSQVREWAKGEAAGEECGC